MENVENRHITQLIGACMAGNREAQEQMVAMTQEHIYYHCRKMLKQEQDALDATQDVLLIMLTSLDKLRNPDAFWGWVNGITANHCKRILAHRGEVWQIPEDEEGGSLLERVEDWDEQQVTDKALDNQETRRMILDLVDSLPPEQRMCVLLYYYDEMSVKEIAQVLGVAEGTVKSRLNYARKAIKAGVENYEQQGIKLYGLSPLPFLMYLLHQDAAAQKMAPNLAQQMLQRVLSNVASSAAPTAGGVGAAASGTGAAAIHGGAATAGTAAATSGGVSVKLIAGVLAGALVIGGGGWAVSTLLHRPEEVRPSLTPLVQATAQPEVSEEPEETEFVVQQPRIQHTDWDQATRHTEVYFEIPVFDNATGGYAAINEFFQQRQAEFFSPANERLDSVREYDGDPNWMSTSNDFYYMYFVMLHDCTEQWFSVTLQENWYMGGTVSGSSENYTFNPRTGELLELTDLVDLSETELEEQIVAALKQQYPGIESEPNVFDAVRDHTMKEFKFYVENGRLHIVFDKYEITDGAADSFDVALSVPLNDPTESQWTLPWNS